MTTRSFLILVCLLLTACVKTPVSERPAFIVIPFSQEVAMGNQAYQELLEKYPTAQDPALVNIVQRVGRRVAAATTMANMDWEFTLFEGEEQNAFALPGGKVGVFTGLLPVCENEAGLAAVLGHEIAHVTARHAAQRISREFLLLGVMTAAQVSLQNSDQRKLILGAMGLGAVYGFSLPFSRSEEAEADQIGLVYMARAGYDPNEALRFWSRFSQIKKGQRIPEVLSTHPADETRIATLRRFLPRALAEYRSQPEQYGTGETFQVAQRLEYRELPPDQQESVAPAEGWKNWNAPAQP